MTDTGIGIPVEDLGHIFEGFEQIADRTHPRRERTGLALPLAKKLVELDGGTILVTSTPRQGSTFTLSVPIASA